MARALGSFETAATLSNDYAPFAVVAVLELLGGPAPERLAGALLALQEYHPLLQVRITESRGGYRYETSGVPPVPLSIVERTGEERWQEVANSELNRRVDDRTGPLLRCSYLPPSGAGARGELVLTCHHAIVDAVSCANLLHRLLDLCAGGEAVDEPSSALPAAADERLPRSVRGLSGGVRRLAFMLRQLADETVYRLRTRGQRPAVPAPTRCSVLPLSLSREQTSALVKATRRRRVTLVGALNAAFLLAVRRHLHGHRMGPRRYMTFADLRPYLAPPASARELGSCITLLRHSIRVGGDDFWSLASRITDQVQGALRRGDKLTSALLCDTMMRIALRQREHRMATVAVSYSGPARLQRSYGDVQVRGLHGFVSNFSLGPEYTAQARLLWGELILDIVYLDAEMDHDRALGLGREILEMLRRESAKE